MRKVGIDTLAVYTSSYSLDLGVLAKVRQIDAEKYYTGLGQHTMSVPPPGEDIVTMAANAAHQALKGIDQKQIAMLLFATESGIDQSKAAGLFIHSLLGLPGHCRVVELKQACYSATAAIQLALPFLRENPDKKVLVIAADVARYGLGTTGESSQGCGAVAMILSADPRILAIEPISGFVAEDVMDFWRPNYLHEALVDGKYSSKIYLQMLEKSWEQYKKISGRQFSDHTYFCFHSPVPKLVEKAHQHLLKLNQIDHAEKDLQWQISSSLQYARQSGNSYSASLYVCLASLLDNAGTHLADKRIGFYSYGSGCVAEYFSGVVQPGYREALSTEFHKNLFANRISLNYEDYVNFYTFKYVEDGSEQIIPEYKTGLFRLTKLNQHKRHYEKVAEQSTQNRIIFPTSMQTGKDAGNDHSTIKVYAPGKLILSGEHSVVYGKPALAMAVNRFVTATVTHDAASTVAFDFADLAHRSQISLDALQHLKQKIKQKYYRFIRGDYSIRDVLQKPFELAQYAMSIFADALNLSLPHGVKIHVQSDIPIGCGMGSSAATIISVMQAISHFMKISVSKDQLFQLALEAENMQHGKSSGLDLRIAMHGGCIYMHGNELQERSLPEMPMYLVNTGMPLSTTGQCVESAAKIFQHSQLADEFAAMTTAMDLALKQQKWREMHEYIRANHQLLIRIGVVPAKVQQFVKQVEITGGAAKICGAGAITGDAAGAVLVVTDDQSSVSSLVREYGYDLIPIAGELRGVYAA